MPELSTEEWEEKIKNPDPRIKWAMDVMDREGEDFENIFSKVWAPLSSAVFPLAAIFARNSTNRVPLRTGLVPAIATMPFFGLVGYYFRKHFDGIRQEEEAMMRHYIITHPELFPEPKKVKFIDHIEPWKPMRH